MNELADPQRGIFVSLKPHHLDKLRGCRNDTSLTSFCPFYWTMAELVSGIVERAY